MADRAYKLLANEQCWLKNFAATDKNGQSIHPESERACKWCTLGAMEAVYTEFSRYSRVYRLLRSNIIVEGWNCISEWNDDPKTTYEMVITKLKQLDI